MPLKIGPVVVSGHWPEIKKIVLPSDKERAIGRLEQHNTPRRTAKPMIQLQAITPWNYYQSVGAVNKAINAIAESASPWQLVMQLRAHIGAYRAANNRPPSLLIVGEAHGAPSSLMMALTVLHEFRDLPGAKTLMCEVRPRYQRYKLPTNDPEVGRLGQCLRTDTPVRRPADEPPHTHNLVMAGRYARHLGFDVRGYDELKHSAQDLEDHEQDMAKSIGNALPTSGLTVVLTGAVHVPALHDKLSPLTEALSMSVVAPVPPGDTNLRSRMSYLLARPEILTVRPSEGLNATELDAVRFIKRELVPWMPPVRV